MADSFINVGNGKLMQTYEGTVSGNTVDAEAVVLVDTTLTPLGTNAGALNVYLNQIIANAGANLNTSALALASGQTNGGQKTQIVDPINASNVAGVTAGALNVYLNAIIANSGANLNTAALALSVSQTNGGQKTQICDPTNSSNVAGIINGALNVVIPGGVGINTSSLALAVTQTNGGQKTLIVDPSNASNAAGITAGALNVYLNAIIANAGTNLNTSALALSVTQTNGGQKTQVVDSGGNIVGTTNLALDVNLKSPAAIPVSGTITSKPTGAVNMANGQVTLSASVVTIVGSRPTRRSVTIRNMDSALDVYIGTPTVLTTSGLILKPRESISIDYTGLIQGLSASGFPVVGYLETYD